MALAAYCYAERRFQGWAQELETEAAVGHRLATRAVDLAPDGANVLWMSSHAIKTLGGNLNRAKELHSLSLRLNPNSFMALTVAALNETRLANPGAAQELLNRAERISPRDPRAWIMTAARGCPLRRWGVRRGRCESWPQASQERENGSKPQR